MIIYLLLVKKGNDPKGFCSIDKRRNTHNAFL